MGASRHGNDAPEQIHLPTGQTVWVRPIEVGDAASLQRAFARLSSSSRYQRFFTGGSTLTDKMARVLTDIDHVDHQALVALPTERATEIVAVARFIRQHEGSTDADLAITVADDWHRRGLASAMLRLLSDRARAAGIHRFTVDMLADNAAIRALVQAAGGKDAASQGALVEGYISL